MVMVDVLALTDKLLLEPALVDQFDEPFAS